MTTLAQRKKLYRASLLASASAAALLLAGTRADAACGPFAPASGPFATCTGDTIDTAPPDGVARGILVPIVKEITVETGARVITTQNGAALHIQGGIVHNFGQLLGVGAGSVGLKVSGDPARELTVDNHFKIIGNGIGIQTFLPDFGTQQNLLTVTNFAGAEITGTTILGIDVSDRLILTNFGTVSGPTGIRTARLTTTGPSTIFNAGTIEGSGGTAIQFGGSNNVLTLAPTSVITGNVLGTGSDAFQLGGSGNGSFDASQIGAAQKYRGFVAFNKIDDSTWTLTGNNNLAMPWTVASGVLAVNGAMPNSTFTVNGATLRGTGTTGSVVLNGGTLSPGNSIGTITVNGNLTFVGPGNYIVEVSPAAADRTNVSGTASLAGTLTLIPTGGTYTIGRYTLLNATGGVSGTFSTGDIASMFGVALRASVSYDGNNVFLNLDPNAISPFVVNGTGNQKSVAGAVDAALKLNQAPAPFLALFGLSAAQLPGALDQLSGEVHVSTAGVLVDESRYMRDAVLGRLRQASYGGDVSMASLSVGGPVAAFANGELDSALAYGKSPIVTKAPMKAPRAESDVVFWAQGFGAWGRFETDGNAATVRRDLAGFITGLDTRVGSNGRLGVAAGYTGSKNALDGRGTADVDTAHIAGYGGWNFGAFNLRAGGAYAFHSIGTDRSIAFPGFFDRTTANYDGHTGQIFGELGYGFAFGNVAIEPFAGAAWVRVKTDAAAERGGLAALNVAGTTFETGYATLGIRVASLIPLGHDMVLVPRGTLAWQHAFDNVTPAGVLAFQAAPVPFTIAGVPIARDSLLAEAGLDLAIGRNATVGVSYVGQLANNVQDHAAKGKFSWKF